MAADPLESLRRQIEAAVALPVAQPYVRSGDPLDRLQAQLRGDAANDDQPRQPQVAASSLDSVIGREALQMVATTALPPAAREEAVRRLAIAIENPTAENARAVLRVVLTGRADA